MSITLTRVSKAFDGKQVLHNFSCTLPGQGVVAVMGKSGSGKSTLINLLLSLIKPDMGAVSVPDSLRFSAVFQDDRLMEHLSAYDNLRLTVPRKKSDLSNALRMLGLNPSERAPVRTYSGGMKRRVSLARGILFPADVLLLDEPFRGLDAETREHAMELLKREWRDRLIVLVTHDAEEARKLNAVQMITMGGGGNGRQGVSEANRD